MSDALVPSKGAQISLCLPDNKNAVQNAITGRFHLSDALQYKKHISAHNSTGANHILSTRMQHCSNDVSMHSLTVSTLRFLLPTTWYAAFNTVDNAGYRLSTFCCNISFVHVLIFHAPNSKMHLFWQSNVHQSREAATLFNIFLFKYSTFYFISPNLDSHWVMVPWIRRMYLSEVWIIVFQDGTRNYWCQLNLNSDS